MSRLLQVAMVSWFVGSAAGCAADGNGYGSLGGVASGTHGAAGAGAGSNTSGSVGTGTSAGGGSSGTTAAVCDQAWVNGWFDGGSLPTECPDGTFELKGRATDACTNGNPIATTLSVADAFHPEISAQTEDCGVYYFCFDAGLQLTPRFIAPGYLTTQTGTLDLQPSGGIGVTGRAGLALFCSNFFDTAVSEAVPPFDDTLPFVYVVVNTFEPLGDACAVRSGWTVEALDLSGQVVDAGTFYVTGLGIVQSDAGTSGEGVAILYDLDPSLLAVTLRVTRPGDVLPDGGLACANAALVAPWQYTGIVPLAVGYFSYMPFYVQ